MVFIGGFRPRRRYYSPYGDYGPRFGGRGYGRSGGRGGNSCGRDLCLVESGCCLAEMLGCGPQLAFSVPSLLRCSVRAARLAPQAGGESGVGAWTVRFALSAIRRYQSDISPQRPAACRYEPTCSAYAAQALATYGALRGGWLAVRRLLRCRPGSPGGLDAVPAT